MKIKLLGGDVCGGVGEGVGKGEGGLAAVYNT
jgi:hypothetical protein